MGVKVKNPTKSQIEELRQLFNAQYAKSPPAVPFHSVDLDRIRNEDLWLQRFLEMHDLNMEPAIKQLWETCVWRQSYGANELDHSNLNQAFLNEGCIFVYNKDVDGKPLLIFRVRLHSKTRNLDELIRIVVYWVERTQRENHLTQMSIFFDMAGTGLATMDLDFVKRIVETFKQYYPNALNYILVFELAWVLNAAFKVIKNLLPPKAVEILKMISKKDVTQYVTKDNCLSSWGGTDSYEYSFVPETKQVTSSSSSSSSAKASASLAANAGDAEQLHPDFANDKKVHFAKSAPMVLHDTNIGDMHTPSDVDSMLQLEPTDYINFCPISGDAKLTLRNITDQAVVYKIQTTSPEKFRVRPRCGVVPANSTADVNIWLKSDHQLSADAKDKFLVMASLAPSPDCGSQEVAELWKERGTNDPDVENHRLICRLAGKSKDAAGCKVEGQGGSQGNQEFGPQQLQEQTKEMNTQLKHFRNLQYATLVLTLLLFAGFGFLIFDRFYNSLDYGGAAGGTCQKTTAFKCAKHK